jgi:hypothetical protein
MDTYLAERMGLRPIYTAKHEEGLLRAHQTLTVSKRVTKQQESEAHRDLLKYLAAVGERDEIHERKTLSRKIRLK